VGTHHFDFTHTSGQSGSQAVRLLPYATHGLPSLDPSPTRFVGSSTPYPAMALSVQQGTSFAILFGGNDWMNKVVGCPLSPFPFPLWARFSRDCEWIPIGGMTWYNPLSTNSFPLIFRVSWKRPTGQPSISFSGGKSWRAGVSHSFFLVLGLSY
jgi:hypothetical protein